MGKSYLAGQTWDYVPLTGILFSFLVFLFIFLFYFFCVGVCFRLLFKFKNNHFEYFVELDIVPIHSWNDSIIYFLYAYSI